MMKIVLLTTMLIAVGFAAVPPAAAHCADAHVPDCVREAREFLLEFGCFNGPLPDPIDVFCWA